MKLLFKNKRAYFDYDIAHTRTAGMVLFWYEVKSIKLRYASINESIIKLSDRELWVVNMQVSQYPKATNITNYNPKRQRKLLLNKREITKIVAKTNKTWFIILLLEIFIDKNSRIKAKIWVWKIRKKVEKKQILKERDVDRQAQRDIKKFI